MPLSPPPQGLRFLWFFFFFKNKAPKRKPRRRPSSCSQPEGVKLVSDMSIFFLDVHYVRSGVFPALGHLHYVAKFIVIFSPTSCYFMDSAGRRLSSSPPFVPEHDRHHHPTHRELLTLLAFT